MDYKKMKFSNTSKANDLITGAMLRRRALAYRSIAKVCDKEIKLRVIK